MYIHAAPCIIALQKPWTPVEHFAPFVLPSSRYPFDSGFGQNPVSTPLTMMSLVSQPSKSTGLSSTRCGVILDFFFALDSLLGRQSSLLHG
jgi:hypothetical protein